MLCDDCRLAICDARCPNMDDETTVVSQCTQCHNNIYAREELWKDSDDYKFCSQECAMEYHDIKEERDW